MPVTATATATAPVTRFDAPPSDWPDVARSGEAAARRAMIDAQLRPNGITAPALLAAVDGIDRSAFAEVGDAALAYTDRSIALGGGRALNPVLTTVRLIDAAAIAPGQHVLLIGGATGYAAALLDAIGARVTAVECDAALAARAVNLLSDASPVTLVHGPLEAGAANGAPYDALIIDGAIAALPAALLRQLRDGARIACGFNCNGVAQLARGVHIAGQDSVSLIAFADLECVTLPGFSPPPQFRF